MMLARNLRLKIIKVHSGVLGLHPLPVDLHLLLLDLHFDLF